MIKTNITKYHIEKYKEYEIILLKDGTYALITGVEPVGRYTTEKTRAVYYKQGLPYRGDKSSFPDDNNIFISDTRSNVEICFNLKESIMTDVSKLISKEAFVLGTLRDDKKLSELKQKLSKLSR